MYTLDASGNMIEWWGGGGLKGEEGKGVGVHNLIRGLTVFDIRERGSKKEREREREEDKSKAGHEV